MSLSPTETAGWKAYVDDQVVPIRSQGTAKQRTRALLTILDVARHRNGAQLAETVPALFDVYDTHPAPQRRILPARALHAIVTNRARSGVRTVNALSDAIQREESERVRRVTIQWLATYHGGRGQTLAVPAIVYVTTLGS